MEVHTEHEKKTFCAVLQKLFPMLQRREKKQQIFVPKIEIVFSIFIMNECCYTQALCTVYILSVNNPIPFFVLLAHIATFLFPILFVRLIGIKQQHRIIFYVCL